MIYVCEGCGREFETSPSRKQKFHNRECFLANQRLTSRERYCPNGHDKDSLGYERDGRCSECRRVRGSRKTYTNTCIECGRPFHPFYREQQFCSRSCGNVVHHPERTCPTCLKTFEPTRATQRFDTAACARSDPMKHRYCPWGHDTWETGRQQHGTRRCRECVRDYKARTVEYRQRWYRMYAHRNRDKINETSRRHLEQRRMKAELLDILLWKYHGTSWKELVSETRLLDEMLSTVPAPASPSSSEEGEGGGDFPLTQSA